MEFAVVLDKKDINTIVLGNRIGIQTNNLQILFTPEAIKEFMEDVSRVEFDEHRNIVISPEQVIASCLGISSAELLNDLNDQHYDKNLK